MEISFKELIDKFIERHGIEKTNEYDTTLANVKKLRR